MVRKNVGGYFLNEIAHGGITPPFSFILIFRF